MARGLLTFLYRETAGSNTRIIAASLASGLSRGVLLAIFNTAAAATARGHLPWYLPAGFAAVLFVYLASSYDSIRRSTRVVETMLENLRLRLSGKLLAAQLRFLEMRGTGEIYTQLSTDLERLRDAAMTFLTAMQAAVLVVFALAYLAWLSVPVFFATILTAAAGAGVYFLQDRDANRKLARARNRETAFFDAVADILHGFKELKLSRARGRDLHGDIGAIAREFRDLWVKSETVFLASALTSQAFMFLLIAIVAFLPPEISHASGARIFQLLATILFVVTPLESLIQSVPAMAKARVSLNSIETLEAGLDLDVAIAKHPEALAPPTEFQTIALKDVRFRFSGASKEEFFDVGPLDLELHRNEILFVVGGNGAGKTTFLKLLTGLYQPSSGTVLVDGREVAHTDQQAYREMFAAVFSDFHLFKRLYGLGNFDPAAMTELLAEMQIADKTRIRDGALTTVNLSTGQRKRLAYAVNRIADRQIYVFDEFAADQDPGFRKAFYCELLPRLKREGKTIVVVTHDERWFDVADRVVKMDYGSIAEIVEHRHRTDAPV